MTFTLMNSLDVKLKPILKRIRGTTLSAAKLWFLGGVGKTLVTLDIKMSIGLVWTVTTGKNS